MDSQRIFILVKPDGVERGPVVELLRRLAANASQLADLTYTQANVESPRMP